MKVNIKSDKDNKNIEFLKNDNNKKKYIYKPFIVILRISI